MKHRDSLSVMNLFNEIAPRYNNLNDLLSFGLHRLWKKRLLKLLNPSLGEKWLDLCCGTGDMSIALARLVGTQGSVLGVDFSFKQLELAEKRSSIHSIESISWMQADILENGLPSNSFDGAVMAYGLRNLIDPEEGFKEIRRLLKPSARAGILDFNHTIDGSLSSSFQKCYLRKIVVPTASILGLKAQYSYLEESLKTFPVGSVQEKMAMKVGFHKAKYKTIAAGQMGILLLS